jgi:cardiolipin synthase
MAQTKEVFWNIPNALSLFRLCMGPVLVGLCFLEWKQVYGGLLALSLATDVVDGMIARRFNLCTQIGAKLDSMADLMTYGAAFVGLWVFWRHELAQTPIPIEIFASVFLCSKLLSTFKFGRPPSYHLYSFKLAGVLQGCFIVSLFIFGLSPLFLYIAALWGAVAAFEEILITLISPKARSNVRGLYWVLSQKR